VRNFGQYNNLIMFITKTVKQLQIFHWNHCATKRI